MKKTFLAVYILSIAISLGTLVSCESSESDSLSIAPSPEGGVGGSTARFAIANGHLYTVDFSNLNVFDLQNPADPTPIQTVAINNDIETIFPRGDKLFIGSQSGMYIYDVANPTRPEQLGLFVHVVSCDPVVADDRYAYVTLRSVQGFCGRNTNQLDVINVEDLRNPFLERTYPMSGPKGLGIDDDLLYVCDDGLKVFDATDPLNLELTQQFPIAANDVIPLEGHLLVTGNDGFYQYQLTAEGLELLSKIEVTPDNE